MSHSFSQKSHKVSVHKDFKSKRDNRTVTEAQAFIESKRKINLSEIMKNVIDGIPYGEISETIFNETGILDPVFKAISSATENYFEFFQ